MPYQANKPLANDQLSQSQQDINGNFLVLGSIGGNANPNSDGINVAPGAGFNYLFLQSVATPPLGTAFGANNALFSSNLAATGKNELFINKNNQAGNVNIPATASILSNTVPVNGLAGWSYLPSGLIIKWGIVPVNNIGPTLQNFNATVPFTNVFAATLGPTDVGAAQAYTSSITALTVNSITVVNRRINNTATFAAANVYYFVIGR